MQTQISIKVKNENVISRCMSIWMSLGLFVKAKVKMYVDSENATPIVLKARKEPYVIDITPGNHVIVFTAKNRSKTDKLIGNAVGGIFGMAGGSATFGASVGGDFASAITGGNRIQDNRVDCYLKEGDILKIQIKPKRNGAVKITKL